MPAAWRISHTVDGATVTARVPPQYRLLMPEHQQVSILR
jgi:hypothetical protein